MKKSLVLSVVAGFLLFSFTVSAQFGATSQRPAEEVKISSVVAITIDEVVTIENRTRQVQDLTDWTLEVSRPSGELVSQYVFPVDCFLAVGATVRVHSGPANVGRSDASCEQSEFDLVWKARFVLPNDVGIVTLKDADGNLMNMFEYPEPITPPVFINEIELNPADGEEWVELFNAGTESIDLTGWVVAPLKGTSVKVNVPVDQVIPAGGFVTVQLPIPFLSDQSEILELRNANGVVVNATPEAGFSDALTDDRCWARMPDGFNAWNFQACTKAATNFKSIF